MQNFGKFISDNKAVMVTGSVSSAEAVADNKFADREKVIYLPGISGSNDTTGKDCVRYSFRECFYGQTAAKALAPQLITTIGKNKKVAYLTPDYTYGHTVQKSMEEYLKEGGWTTVTDQVSPLGTTDFSSYLLNVANSGADVVVNINFGRDAVLSIKQAKQFGILEKMTLAVPYNTPFLAKEVGADTMQGVLAATDYWWTLEDKFPLAKMFNDAFRAKYKSVPEWGANCAYMQIAMWADAVERAKSFYPPDVIKAYEAGAKIQSTVGEVYFRGADHQLVRPVIIERGKKPADMKNPDDYYEIVEVVPGAGFDAGAGRLRMQDWAGIPDPNRHSNARLHLLSWSNFLSQTFNGLVLGALLALMSSGLTIIYGTLGVLNLAHGAMFMVGGYAGVVAYQYTGSYLVAIAAGACFVLVLGVADGADRHPTFLRPARRGSDPRDVRTGHRLRRGRSLPLRQPVAIHAAAELGRGRHFARLHDLSDLPPRGRRHRRARAAGALSRSLSLAPGHDRARGNRGFGDGRFARHQYHAGLHDRVRHRLDGGRLRRHRQCPDRADHARHRRIDLWWRPSSSS